jgi:glyoxylase-like metal-dependent hydrolase (beta-lactamase superfamily II)
MRNTTYQAKVIKVGQADVPAPEVFWMSHWGEWQTLFFYIVLIQGDGITAVVNTGPPANLSDLNQRWRAFAGERCQMLRAEHERPAIALEAAGVRLEEVTHVLITPLQVYATANIPLFPNARICLSRRGWVEDIFARPAWLHVPRELCIPDHVLSYVLFEARDRLQLLEDEDDIAPGLRAWWAGTHHRSSMTYMVNTTQGAVAITDCAFKYGNLDGHPLGISESLAEGSAAYSRIRREAAHVVPLYDPEVLDRYPGGLIA